MINKSILMAVLVGSLSSCVPNYSEGSRVGVITKLSYKGIFFKSWEGSINQGGTKVRADSDGNSIVVANAIDFNVQDPIVIARLTQAYKTGKRVEIVYAQWLVSPITQESAYVVVDVKEAE